jgi:DNA gyrase/topoisomerase IV subunit A
MTLKNGKKAVKLASGDRLKHVDVVREGDGILIGGVDGQVIHFASDTIRSSSRSSGPSRGIKIRGGAKDVEEEVEAVGTDGEEGEEEVEHDDAEAKPAEVAGLAVVPAAVVKSLGLSMKEVAKSRLVKKESGVEAAAGAYTRPLLSST